MTQRTLPIRALTPSDSPEWLRLRLALWPDDPVADHQAQMDEVRTNPQQAVFVVQRPDGRLGGFIEVSLHPRAIGCSTHNVAYVEGWYVDPDLRCAGHGRRLMAAAEDWGRRMGAAEIASDTLLENDLSRTAHLRLGFAEAGRLIHFAKRL